MAQQLLGDGRLDAAQPAEPAGRGNRPGEHPGQRRLVELDEERARPGSRRRTSATCAARPSAREAARSRQAPRSASALSPWGSSTVAASVHGPADLDLERADVPLGELLERVEVLAQEGLRPALVPPGGRRRSASPTAGRRRAGRRAGQAAAGEVGAGAAGRQLRQVRQVRQLAEDQPYGLADIDARQRADAGRGPVGPVDAQAAVRAIGRGPDDSGARVEDHGLAGGDAVQRLRASCTTTEPSPDSATAGTASPCARTCAVHGMGAAGGSASHRALTPSSRVTASASRGPTVTVRVTGEMSST